jgi:oligosaccharide translocation protein RFT1
LLPIPHHHCPPPSPPTHTQVEKLVLAEGSKLALVGFESSYNQGVYGLVANLGSLVVRLLFTPIEEAAFTAFSR